jgi:metacaspase-1
VARSRTPKLRSARRRAQLESRVEVPTSGGHHVVYVHGICRHEAGYSDPWWAALKPYIAEVPDQNRHEVLWSDVITPAVQQAAALRYEPFSAAAQALSQFGTAGAQPEVIAHIKDILADRAQRQLIKASLETAARQQSVAVAVGPTRAFMTLETVGPQALLGIPNLECIDDFAKYLLESTTRDQVLERFDAVVKPLLQGGAKVEVISHSWGTVVAYEALRRMNESDGELANGSVHNLFTVGSALAIPPVKRHLLPVAMDGRRPRVVQGWVNLNARFDIVGGHLRGNPFAVDYEYLELVPVGCSLVIPNPSCAHGSYFHPANEAVNKKIFARYIQG